MSDDVDSYIMIRDGFWTIVALLIPAFVAYTIAYELLILAVIISLAMVCSYAVGRLMHFLLPTVYTG